MTTRRTLLAALPAAVLAAPALASMTADQPNVHGSDNGSESEPFPDDNPASLPVFVSSVALDALLDWQRAHVAAVTAWRSIVPGDQPGPHWWRNPGPNGELHGPSWGSYFAAKEALDRALVRLQYIAGKEAFRALGYQ